MHRIEVLWSLSGIQTQIPTVTEFCLIPRLSSDVTTKNRHLGGDPGFLATLTLCSSSHLL